MKQKRYFTILLRKQAVGNRQLRTTALCTLLALSSLLCGAHCQTLTLDSCMALARRNNAEIRTSLMEIEHAREVKRQVFNKYFPQVSLGGLGYYAATPLVHFGIDDIQSSDMRELIQALYDLVSSTGSDVKNELSLMKKGVTGSVMAAQPLYTGGRIATGNKLARMGITASELQAEIKMRDIMEGVESTYLLVVGLQQKVATVNAALALIDSIDRVVQTAMANGLVTRADALQVQLKRNEMLANQQQLASGIKLSKRLLCCQIGIDYSDAVVFVDPQFDMPPLLSLASQADNDALRPEVRLLQLGVDAEQLQRRLTIGEALPQLSLISSAYYGNMIRTDLSGNAVALLSLSVPLSAWGETSHKLKQHNIRIAEARLKQEHYNHMMALEEEKAYSDMVDAYMLLKSDSTALSVAKENYRLANLNYSAGLTTLSELLQAHALLLQAQNAITDRHTAYIVARRRLHDLRHNKGEK
ncbi:MAG: TolC family protein [Bacteroidales bacterium]|nr:TolC family protein [Bacteroidales bacterium]